MSLGLFRCLSVLSLLLATMAHAQPCVIWPSGSFPNPNTTPDNAASLNTALALNTCVTVAAGEHHFQSRLFLPSGHTLTGQGQDQTKLVVSSIGWKNNQCSDIPTPEDCKPTDRSAIPDPTCTPRENSWQFKSGQEGLIEVSGTGSHTISDLTVDGSDRATIGLSVSNTAISRVTVRRASCDGITAKENVIISDSVIKENGRTCLTRLGGSGIYTSYKEPDPWTVGSSQPKPVVVPGDYGLVIQRNTIIDNYGPGVDINGVWGGVLLRNTITGNRLFGGVSLYAASYWSIMDNLIEHFGQPACPSCTNKTTAFSVTDTIHEPARQFCFKPIGIRDPSSYHGHNPAFRYCAGGPAGIQPAGVVLCQLYDNRDEGAAVFTNFVTTHNYFARNKIRGFYGILSIGADCHMEGNQRVCPSVTPPAEPTEKEYWVPRFNAFHDNDVNGSTVGCADDFEDVQRPEGANSWVGNNCGGANQPSPDYF